MIKKDNKIQTRCWLYKIKTTIFRSLKKHITLKYTIARQIEDWNILLLLLVLVKIYCKIWSVTGDKNIFYDKNLNQEDIIIRASLQIPHSLENVKLYLRKYKYD